MDDLEENEACSKHLETWNRTSQSFPQRPRDQAVSTRSPCEAALSTAFMTDARTKERTMPNMKMTGVQWIARPLGGGLVGGTAGPYMLATVPWVPIS